MPMGAPVQEVGTAVFGKLQCFKFWQGAQTQVTELHYN